MLHRTESPGLAQRLDARRELWSTRGSDGADSARSGIGNNREISMSDETAPPKGEGLDFAGSEANKALEKAFIDAGLATLATGPEGPTGRTPRGAVIPFVRNGGPMVVMIGPPIKGMVLLAEAMQAFVGRHEDVNPLKLLAALLGSRGSQVEIVEVGGLDDDDEECDCPKCVAARANPN